MDVLRRQDVERMINMEDDIFVVPVGIKIIGDYAFTGLSIEEVVLPDTITCIGKNAFSGCSKLQKINLPQSLEEICDGAFSFSALQECLIPANTRLGKKVFYNCPSLVCVQFSRGAIKIPKSCFAHCTRLSTLILPDTIRFISDMAFMACESLGMVCPCLGEALKGIQLPKNLRLIGRSAFKRCTSLSWVVLPYQLRKIKENAFKGCLNLQVVNLPSNPILIGYEAFFGCPNLIRISWRPHINSKFDYAFENLVAKPSGGYVEVVINPLKCDFREYGGIEVLIDMDVINSE